MRLNDMLARAVLATLGLALAAASARADSVAQIATSVRISRSTATLIDPQGRPGMVGMGTRTAARPGDVLTFIASFTPVPNGGLRGLGGYVTFYIPRNTEVVGVRLIDSSGDTAAPHRGGLAADGAGPRGATGFSAPLVGGSLSQLYADTGIFYATDRRTNRVPTGAVAAQRFISLFNGIELMPQPTGARQLQPILGATSDFAHNQWDAIQAYGFGVRGAALGTGGEGQTPDRYGSPVAGSQTWYRFEASYSGSLARRIDLANVVATGRVGPWRRIRSLGAEIGRRGNAPPMPDPGLATRVGVPAVDVMGRPLGVVLDGDSPLPSHDAAMPRAYTRAVRYAVGELVVGEEYLSEISLRVLDTPLDPVAMDDVVCAEVFGGDASSQVAGGTDKGKDNAWRYFLPAPACVSLDLLFDLDVNKLVAVPGDRLIYTIHGKNLATTPHHNVVVRHCYTPGEVTFVSATPAGTRAAGAGCPDPATQDDISWTIPLLLPGDEFDYTVRFDAVGGGRRGSSTIANAIFTSDELPAPGFQTVAFTVIDVIAVPTLSMTATPDTLATPPGTVTYRARIQNDGTGAAEVTGCRNDPCRVIVTLPAGFRYIAGSAAVGGAAVANPAVRGRTLTFTSGLRDVPPGGAMVIRFRVRVPGSTAPGAYTSTLETWLHDVSGQTVSDSRGALAEVVVGMVRSDVPVITGTLADGATRVCGTTTEAAGTTIRLYSAGVEIAAAMSAAGGMWCVTVPTLYAGQHVSATAEATGELESPPTAEVSVAALGGGGTAACNDGLDNDGDGLIDFPMDPDCVSPGDPDEAHVPECADGVDNDGNGDTDFGADLGCSSLLDDSEDGVADCMNMMDDDGDGLADFPDDLGCDSATDVSEVDLPECADGVDNDGDGLVDFPRDPECTSALDDDESVRVDATSDAGLADAGGTDAGPADAGRTGDAGGLGADGGAPPDWGGVDEPGSGCGCVAAGAPRGGPGGWLVLGALPVLFAFFRIRRRG